MIKYCIIFFVLIIVVESKTKLIVKTLFILITVLLVNTFTWQHHLILLLVPIFYLSSLKLAKVKIFLLFFSVILLSINIKDIAYVEKNNLFNAFTLSHGTLGLMVLWFLYLAELKVSLSSFKKYTHVFVALFFFLSVCFITRPLIFHLSRYTFGVQDELLITWIMNWNIHAAHTNIFSLFNTNSYYPYLNTLAYSDTHFIASIIGFIPKIFLQEPIVVYNTVIIFALSSLAFCTYYLVFRLSKNIPASIVAGTLVSFSSYTLSKFMHPQLLLIFFVPLSILFFIRFFETKQYRFLLLCCLCFLLQTYNSFLPGYFILFSIGVMVVGYRHACTLQIFNKKNVLTVFITGLLLVPLIKPYLDVSKQFSYVRDIRDSIHFANRIEYTFYPSNRTNLNSFLLHTIYNHDTGPYFYDGYISLSFYILLFGVLIYLFFKNRRKIHRHIITFLFIGLGSWLISLGPALQWRGHVIKWPFIIPLPYAVFYYLVPGFNGLRNSARWEMLMLLSLSVVIGLGLSIFFSKVSSKISWAITITVIILTLWEHSVPFQFYPLPQQRDFPSEYQYLAAISPSDSVLETPWYSWEMLPYSHDEQLRLYYSTVHYRNLVNGASGFSPPSWVNDARWFAKNFPNRASIQYLKKRNVRYLIVHRDDFDKLNKIKFSMAGKTVVNGESIIKILSENQSLKVIKLFMHATVYEVL